MPVVLIVDDERAELDLFRNALEGASCTVWTAGTFDEAILKFLQHGNELDLLVVDVSLPQKNGIDLAEELSSQKPGLKILFISGWIGAEVLGAHGVSVQGQHFLQKPFGLGTFLNRVREILKSDQPSPLPRKRNGKAASNGG